MNDYICKDIDICEHSDKECKMIAEATWQLPHRCPKTKSKIAWELSVSPQDKDRKG